MEAVAKRPISKMRDASGLGWICERVQPVTERTRCQRVHSHTR